MHIHPQFFKITQYTMCLLQSCLHFCFSILLLIGFLNWIACALSKVPPMKKKSKTFLPMSPTWNSHPPICIYTLVRPCGLHPHVGLMLQYFMQFKAFCVICRHSTFVDSIWIMCPFSPFSDSSRKQSFSWKEIGVTCHNGGTLHC